MKTTLLAPSGERRVAIRCDRCYTDHAYTEAWLNVRATSPYFLYGERQALVYDLSFCPSCAPLIAAVLKERPT